MKKQNFLGSPVRASNTCAEAMMSGDYSRFTFDPRRDYSGLLLQQGRVLLDQDWNEQSAIVIRSFRAAVVGVVGRFFWRRRGPSRSKVTAVAASPSGVAASMSTACLRRITAPALGPIASWQFANSSDVIHHALTGYLSQQGETSISETEGMPHLRQTPENGRRVLMCTGHRYALFSSAICIGNKIN